MKEIRFRLIIIIAGIALTLFLLYPTFQDYQNGKSYSDKSEQVKDSILSINPDISKQELEKTVSRLVEGMKLNDKSYQDARSKRLKLGLDLQGGMYIVMEVNTAKLIEKLARDPDQTFNELLAYAEEESKLSEENIVTILSAKLQEKGIRLSRYFGSVRDDDTDIINSLLEQEKDAVTRATQIIRNRVDQYGVSEPSIQQQGSRRIIIELPGVANEEEAKRLLQGRALLEFRMVKDADFTIPIMNRIDTTLAMILKPNSPQNTDLTVNAVTDTSDTNAVSEENLTPEEFAQEHPFFSLALINPQSQYADAYVKEQDKPKLLSYLENSEISKLLPDNVEFAFSAKPEIIQDGINYYTLYLVNKTPELTGGVVVDAQANIDPETTAPIVTMEMNAEGARDWARITGANIGKRCAILLDGVIYSAPVIQNKIPTGRSQISGMANLEESKLLEIVLKAGALPAPVDIIEERTVGPSLGQDSISQGLNSAMFGYLLVAIFMIFYYKNSGGIADIGLLLTILFAMGILAGFSATLTLPGIAGIVLTMGMAVDANVLIFERIREEKSLGKTDKAALEAGYSHSYSAIFDSNITTFFTGLILYQFGSGPVQGFALTLMIGILTSLFGALVVARVAFDFLLNKGFKLNVG